MLATGISLRRVVAAHERMQNWTLSPATFVDTGGDWLSATGTLKGDVAYPVNTYRIDCGKDRQHCRIAYADKIVTDQ